MKSPYKLNRKKRKALKMRMKRHDIFKPSPIQVAKALALTEWFLAESRRMEHEILYGTPGGSRPVGIITADSITPSHAQKGERG